MGYPFLHTLCLEVCSNLVFGSTCHENGMILLWVRFTRTLYVGRYTVLTESLHQGKPTGIECEVTLMLQGSGYKFTGQLREVQGA